MTDPAATQLSGRLRSEIAAGAVIIVIIALTVAVLYGPVVRLPLTGDTYQWVQHAHEASHRPLLLVADLDGFFRPSATWKLIIDRVLWGGFNAAGFRTSSAVLHGLAAFFLWLAGRRIGLGGFSAGAVAVLWAASPFTDESVFVVACSHQPLLLIPWLVMIVVWPRSDQRWSTPRLLTVALMVIAAAVAKETWVVTPGLVAALEYERSRSLRRLLAPTSIVTGMVGLYIVAYLACLRGSKPYLELGWHAVAKIPAQLAAFWYLEEPSTIDIRLSWIGLFATVVTAALLASCLKWNVPGSLVASSLLLLPTIPTLFVPYMPQRYLAIPYSGFLLLIALWVDAIGKRHEERRSLIRAVSVAMVILVLTSGVAIVRGDLEDYRRIAAAHAVLLDEAARVAGALADGDVVVVVRDERTTPLLDVIRSPVGYPKLAFIRNYDPYGLIDTAALFEWVLADEATRVEHVADVELARPGGPGKVLIHRDGGFVDLGSTPDVADQVDRWRSSGRGLQVVRRTAIHESDGSRN